MTKREQRETIRALRNGLGSEEAAGMSEVICSRLAGLPELLRAKRVFSYLALPGEADLSTVHDLLRTRGAEIAFPKTFGGGVMRAYIPDEADAFTVGALGIREPDPARSRPAEPESFDLVLVPCVGFDADGARLGHGAGYYDRYLPGCVNAVLISPAFEFQRLDKVAADEKDVPMDIIVTEEKLYRKSGGC